MKQTMTRWLVAGCCAALLRCAAENIPSSAILTPPPPAEPRINGPTVFGVRPGSPFLYRIPATGERPMTFSVEGLPEGLSVDPASGRISGTLDTAGDYPVVLKASNARAAAEKKFRIVVGEKIALTPPLGWNSWNCWADAVSQEKVLRAAQAIAASGLADHGWSYVNIDDTWQGDRSGPLHAIQGNEKFPDMKRLCDEVHGLGLKVGIYSTPWVTSYAGFRGGSADTPDGAWTNAPERRANWRHGKISFAVNDARQWSAWGIDYLKYDWNPNDILHVAEMSLALRASGRDIVFSLSNSAPFTNVVELARLANCWRTTGDIVDAWSESDKEHCYAVSEIGFSQERWAPHASPGHWNDPDMMVLGKVGWGPTLNQTTLTPDEQYSHVSLWCLLSAPLLVGCDLEQLDPFTLNLLTNDEVLSVNQDALGRQAVRVATRGPIDAYLKELEDGSWALGLFNRGDKTEKTVFNKFRRIGIPGRKQIRDLWRQQDLGEITDDLPVAIPPHGVLLLKVTRL